MTHWPSFMESSWSNGNPTVSWAHEVDYSEVIRRMNELIGIIPNVAPQSSEEREDNMSRASMTRQHFDAIAEAISGIRGLNIRSKMAETITPVLQRFNESFDQARFMTACRVSCNERPTPTAIPTEGDWTEPFRLPGAPVSAERQQLPMNSPDWWQWDVSGNQWVYSNYPVDVEHGVNTIARNAAWGEWYEIAQNNSEYDNAVQGRLPVGIQLRIVVEQDHNGQLVEVPVPRGTQVVDAPVVSNW